MEASEKASVASGKAPRIIFTFCNLLRDVRGEKRKPNRGPHINSPTLAQKCFKFFATSSVPIRRSGQATWSLAPV